MPQMAVAINFADINIVSHTHTKRCCQLSFKYISIYEYHFSWNSLLLLDAVLLNSIGHWILNPATDTPDNLIWKASGQIFADFEIVRK